MVLAWHLAGPRSQIVYAAGSAGRSLAELPAGRAAMIPVIGAHTLRQLDEALGALELELTADDLADLDAA